MANKQAPVIKSMTAFGRATLHSSLGIFHIDIQSINRRHLEIYLSLPKPLNRFEISLRKWVEAFIARGNVQVNLQWKPSESIPPIAPNIPLVKALKKGWKEIAAALEIKEEISLSLLSKNQDLFTFEEGFQEEDLFLETLQQVTEEALKDLTVMRVQEGERLLEDFFIRIPLMEEKVQFITEKAQDAPHRFREKLSKRLEELFQGHPENEEKVLREIA